MVALELQEFRYNRKENCLRRLVFPVLFCHSDGPPTGGTGVLAQGLGIRLFAFGGAYWPLATAHSDPLWARTCVGRVNGAPGWSPGWGGGHKENIRRHTNAPLRPA